MSENETKAEGTWDKLAGKVKQGVGDLTDDERMQAEGKAQELGGEAQVERGKAEGRAKGTWDETKGSLKKNVGDLLDDERMQAEGKAEELGGKARREANR